VPRLLLAATRRCRIRRRTLGRCAEEPSKHYQLHAHRGKVTLTAMYLRRGGVVGCCFGRTYVIVVSRPVRCLWRRDSAASEE
jgi:hypothetical protein